MLVFSGCASNSITPYVRAPSQSQVDKLPYEVGLYLSDEFVSYDHITSQEISSGTHEMTFHLGESSVDLWTKGLANSFERVTVVSEQDESLPPGLVFLKPAIDNVFTDAFETTWGISYVASLRYDVEILASNKDVLETLRGKGNAKVGFMRNNLISLLAAFVTFSGSAYITENSDVSSTYKKAFAKAQRRAFESILEQLDQHRDLFETE